MPRQLGPRRLVGPPWRLSLSASRLKWRELCLGFGGSPVIRCEPGGLSAQRDRVACCSLASLCNTFLTLPTHRLPLVESGRREPVAAARLCSVPIQQPRHPLPTASPCAALDHACSFLPFPQILAARAQEEVRDTVEEPGVILFVRP